MKWDDDREGQYNFFLHRSRLRKPPTMHTVTKMHSRCFGIIGVHGNFAFNLVVKLSVELGYVFSKFDVINSVNV
jgi:hypothetical protein